MRLLPHKKSNNTTREKIKEATFELLAEKGYASISSRDIAKRADTAVGQLTYYYKTKDNLITEVIDDLIETIIENLEKAINKSDSKIDNAKEFFKELLKDDQKTTRIIIDLISQGIYNNSLSNRASKFLEDINRIIVEAYKIEGTEKPENKAEELINIALGKIVRKNIEMKYKEQEEEDNNDNSIAEEYEKRKSKKKLTIRAIFE